MFLNISGFLEGASIKRLSLKGSTFQNLRMLKSKKMVISDTGIITIIEPAEGKYWGLAFIQLMIKHFELPPTEWAVTEKMENLCLHCFAGLPPHHGFVSAFKVGSTVKITLR